MDRNSDKAQERELALRLRRSCCSRESIRASRSLTFFRGRSVALRVDNLVSIEKKASVRQVMRHTEAWRGDALAY